MSEPLSPELEARAQDMARRLVATTDDILFGDTEFALRHSALGLVADADTEHLPQQVGTPPPPSTAPPADAPHPLAEMGPLLRRPAAQVGLGQTDEGRRGRRRRRGVGCCGRRAGTC